MQFSLLLPLLSVVHSIPVEFFEPSVHQTGEQRINVGKNVASHTLQNNVVVKNVLDYLPVKDARAFSQVQRITYDRVSEKDFIRLDPVKYIGDLAKKPYNPEEMRSRVKKVVETLEGKTLTADLWKTLSWRNYLKEPNPWEDWGEEVFNSIANGKIKIADELVEEVLLVASGRGKTKVVELLLKDPRLKSIPAMDAMSVLPLNMLDAMDGDFSLGPVQKAISMAALTGKLDIVKLLLNDERFGPKDVNIKLAFIAPGAPEVIEFLKNDPAINQGTVDFALKGAVLTPGSLKVLLQDHRVTADTVNKAMESAAHFGNHDVVDLLLKDPRVTAETVNKALSPAARVGSAGTGAFKLILQDPRVTAESVNEELSTATRSEETVEIDAYKLILQDHRVTEESVNNAITDAVRSGNTDALGLLLQDHRVTAEAVSNAMTEAVRFGNIYTLVSLLQDPRVTAEAVNNALRTAKDPEIKGVLLRDHRVNSFAKLWGYFGMPYF